MLENIIVRIRNLTKKYLQNKKPLELFLSAAEEYGELAEELSVNGRHKYTKKAYDEGINEKSVDLFICAISLFFVNSDDTSLIHCRFYPKTNIPIITTFHNMALDLYNALLYSAAAANLAQKAIDIYSGSGEEFIEYCNKKLDKWNKNYES